MSEIDKEKISKLIGSWLYVSEEYDYQIVDCGEQLRLPNNLKIYSLILDGLVGQERTTSEYSHLFRKPLSPNDKYFTLEDGEYIFSPEVIAIKAKKPEDKKLFIYILQKYYEEVK